MRVSDSSRKFTRALCRFHALFQRRDQRDAHEVLARIDAVRFAREEAAGQNRDIIIAVQGLREFGVGNRRFDPQVKRGIGQFDAQCVRQNRRDGGEL